MADTDLIRRTKVLLRHYREHGLMRTMSWLWKKIFRVMSKSMPIGKADVLAGLDFVRLRPVPSDADLTGLSRKTLNWFIPPFGRGSGGHLNIFRFISNLEDLGFQCNIIIVANNEPLEDEEILRTNIVRWFMPLKAGVYRGIKNAPPAYFSIATEWRTAYYVRAFGETVKRCYFVQDFEPWFFPVGSEFYLAEETYRFGFVGITAGGWLKDKLAKEYGMTTHSVGFSYDQDLYKPPSSIANMDGVKRVFFYARPPTPRRAFELGLLALEQVAKKTPGVEIILAGWDLSGYSIPFEHTDLGVLSLDALPDVYKKCSVALVLSLTNLSLLPLELMACGVPIVSNEGPNNEWLLNSENSKLSRPTPDKLSEAICEVLFDDNESARLIKAGFETAKKTSWKSEAQKMANVLRSMT